MTGALPLWLTPAIIALTFLLCALAETRWPLRRTLEDKARRIVRNLTTGAVSLAVLPLIQLPLLIPVGRMVERESIGLVQWLGLTGLWKTAAAIVLLDYTLWFWHWASHRVPFLWRFHLVHHVDLDMDASTALRFHFGEIALSAPVRALQILVIGADAFSLAVWQAILFASILFHHSNLRLPFSVERVLVRFVVTPRMHGIHHADREDATNSNWSSILSVWDVLHRTFRFDLPDDAVRIGVPAWHDRRDVTIGRLLLMPFRPQRPDWETGGNAR
jgi:sterol desaturase/sphingolipid hydroxylase (fatty acid hydroxylase superfamily)